MLIFPQYLYISLFSFSILIVSTRNVLLMSSCIASDTKRKDAYVLLFTVFGN